MLLESASPAGLGTLLLLGTVLGLRHSLDPDHLAAVAATVARHPDRRRAVLIGASWGVGHAATVLAVGFLVIAAGLVLPSWLALVLEGAVGVILVYLGVDLLRTLRRERLHLHVHDHGGRRHVHLHGHRHGSGHDHAHPGRRALLVGMAHGLAGSAAVTLLAVAATPSRLDAVLFLGAFGLAATASMALVTAVLAVPLVAVARRGGRALAACRAACAVTSLAVGLGLLLGSLQAAGSGH